MKGSFNKEFLLSLFLSRMLSFLNSRQRYAK
nr:MAG TPA: hypothetical protein [Crassvirales sp.]